jgi:hypothetical protein
MIHLTQVLLICLWNKNIVNKLTQREKSKPKITDGKKHKTKEELAEIRKQMMKKRHRSTSPNTAGNGANQDKSVIDVNFDDAKSPTGTGKQKKNFKEPSNDLLERLAGGKKQKVIFFNLNF